MTTSIHKALVELSKIYRLGQFPIVLSQSEAFVGTHPEVYDLWNIRGAAQNALGQYDAARESFERACKLKPHLPEAHLNHAIALSALERFEEAIAASERALAIRPDYAHAHHNIGNAHRKNGNLSAARAAYKNALTCNPKDAEAYHGLGIVLRQQGDREGAAEAFSRACAADPNHADAYNNLGAVRLDQARSEAALEAFEKARSLRRDTPGIYGNIGSALAGLGRFEEALTAMQTALELNPESAAAHSNIGIVLRDLGRPDDAIAAYERALAIAPHYPEAQTNKAYAHLLKGELRLGFELMEMRLLQGGGLNAKPPRSGLEWDGQQDLTGTRFHVYQEQGLGDIIQFSRYLNLLEDRGAKVLFLVTPKLQYVLRMLGCRCEFVMSQPPADQIDFEAPLMSLPHLFGTELDTVPAPTPYYPTDPVRPRQWMPARDETVFRIGICWQGSRARSDLGRSFPLSYFAGLAEMPGVELVSLHKGAGEDQLRQIPFDVTILPADFDAGDDAFADTAAVMETCDLIVTSDTAIAHLAGALGCDTWVILQAIPNWRWLLQGRDCPWYPTVKLYRQKQRGDWAPVFREVEADLRILIDGKQASFSAPRVQVSWGELIDKMSILRIKAEKLTDPAALKNVTYELGQLSDSCDRHSPEKGRMMAFEKDLIAINRKLWGIEDALRLKEKQQSFDAEFIELARQVYLTNDERARIKQQINDAFPTALREEKSYLD